MAARHTAFAVIMTELVSLIDEEDDADVIVPTDEIVGLTFEIVEVLQWFLLVVIVHKNSILLLRHC